MSEYIYTLFRAHYAPDDFNGLTCEEIVRMLKNIRKEERKCARLGLVHISRINDPETRRSIMDLARAAKSTGRLQAGAGFLTVWACY